MAPGQQSPYSAISAMAIDPIFITVPTVPEFAAIGGEAALGDEDRTALVKVRSAARIDYAEIRRLKKSALRAAFARFLETDWCRDTPAMPAVEGVSQRAGVVGRGLRAVPGDPCARGGAAVDPMARCPSAPGSGRHRSCAPRAVARGAVPAVPAVGRRRPMEGRPCAGARRAAVWRPAVHGRRRQRGCLVAAGSVPAGRLARRAARCVQRDRDRTGACRSIAGM